MNENYNGQVLRKAREEKGIPLEMVHEALKIPLDALRAIEEGYNIKNLSGFYLRGFIKIYAKYLNVDINEVITDYKKEQLPPHIKKEVNFYNFSFLESFKKFFTRQRQRQSFVILGSLLCVFLLMNVIKGCSKNRPAKTVIAENNNQVERNNPRELQKSQVPEKIKPVETKNLVHPKEEVKQAVVQPIQDQVQAAKIQQKQKDINEITLTIRTKKNNWLKVKVDGQTVFQSSLDKGSVETWKAKENIEVTAKCMHEVEFEINGRLIGPLSKKEVSSKRVLITKDGLQILK